MSDIKCTACGSTDVQKLSMVHQSGISRIDATATGTAKSFGDFAPFAETKTRTTGTQVSELAQQAAPPQPKSMALWVVLALALGIGPWFLNIHLEFIVWPLCGYMAWRTKKYNETVYAPRREQWNRSWMCHRCGSVFAV